MQATSTTAIGGAAALDLFDTDDREAVALDIDRALIDADKARLLFRQLPASIGLTLLAAAVTTAVIWRGVPGELLAVWWAAIGASVAGRLALYRSYRRHGDSDPASWLRRFALGALATGATWGFAGTVFFPAGGDDVQVFLAFVLAGMVAGGIPALSAAWQVYAAYAVALLAPIAYMFVATGNTLFMVLGALAPVVLLASLSASVQLSRTFEQAFRMRRAYREIAGRHAEMNAQLQEQLDALANAHDEISASGRKLAMYVDRAPIAVFELDADGTISSANPMAEKMFGWLATEIEGRSLLRILFQPDRPLLDGTQWRGFVERGIPITERKTTCVRRDGLEILCELSLTPLVGSAGETLSVIVHCNDITRQEEAERMKKEFTSTLSHELRTPLTSIIGSLQLVNSGTFGDVEPDVLDLTSVAERNGQRLLDLINDILDIEKLESGRFTLDLETISLGEIIGEATVLNKGFAERHKVRLETHGLDAPVNVVVDRKRLMQVMTNLVSNAAKFSPEGEAVEVTVRRDGALVRVSVEDRGSGIPLEFRGRIFSRFAQADSVLTRTKGGTGLGLAISKRLTEMMGGSIGFEDREGGGTCFFFDLPVAS